MSVSHERRFIMAALESICALTHEGSHGDPFGPFEPSVELDESQAKTLLRSLEAFEAVRTSGDGSFTVDLSEDQPLIVRNMLSGNRLELPIFEAAELDAQRLYGYPPTYYQLERSATQCLENRRIWSRVGGGHANFHHAHLFQHRVSCGPDDGSLVLNPKLSLRAQHLAPTHVNLAVVGDDDLVRRVKVAPCLARPVGVSCLHIDDFCPFGF